MIIAIASPAPNVIYESELSIYDQHDASTKKKYKEVRFRKTVYTIQEEVPNAPLEEKFHEKTDSTCISTEYTPGNGIYPVSTTPEHHERVLKKIEK